MAMPETLELTISLRMNDKEPTLIDAFISTMERAFDEHAFKGLVGSGRGPQRAVANLLEVYARALKSEYKPVF